VPVSGKVILQVHEVLLPMSMLPPPSLKVSQFPIVAPPSLQIRLFTSAGKYGPKVGLDSLDALVVAGGEHFFVSVDNDLGHLFQVFEAFGENINGRNIVCKHELMRGTGAEKM
jgi:hypothetical protein